MEATLIFGMCRVGRRGGTWPLLQRECVCVCPLTDNSIREFTYDSAGQCIDEPDGGMRPSLMIVQRVIALSFHSCNQEHLSVPVEVAATSVVVGGGGNRV